MNRSRQRSSRGLDGRVCRIVAKIELSFAVGTDETLCTGAYVGVILSPSLKRDIKKVGERISITSTGEGNRMLTEWIFRTTQVYQLPR